MLSTDDLHQISLLLDQKLDQKLAPIYEILDGQTKILDEHTKILEKHSKLLDSHAKQLKNHSKLLRELKNNQNLIIDTFDRDQIHQNRRLDRIETNLELPILSLR